EVWEVARESLAGWLPYVAAYSSTDHNERAALDRLIVAQIPIIPDRLKAQLELVEPTIKRDISYRPCRVRLRDGAILDRVLVVEAEPYIKHWGGWPQLSSTPNHLDISEVVSLEESPFRLPARLATKMYEAGESGMGYCFFTLVLHDGRRLPMSTSNAVDFPDLPAGISPEMVADVLPHEGRDLVWQDGADGPSPPPQAVRWCLYRAHDS
ncbi:MAG: hypothetical protein LC749_10100, partial [Actinobacteria bacterium]|nr:hypothetical protein [Actinomycetota bacterium]